MVALRSMLTRQPRYGIGAAARAFSPRLPAYLRITDIDNDSRFAPSPLVSVDSPMSANYVLENGDIVVARTGASVGKSYRYRPEDGVLVYAGFLIAITPDPELLDPEYLAFYLRSKPYWDWIAAESTRSGQPGINAKQLATLDLIVPSISAQHGTASRLHNAEELEMSLKRLIAKKESLRHGMMQQLLTSRSRLPGFSSPWEKVKLGSVASMNSGGTPPSSVPKYYGGGIPWVSIADMTSSGKYISQTATTLSQEGLTASPARMYEPDVVLYAMYASLGECSLAMGRVSSSQAILGIDVGARLDREFLYYWLKYVRPQVKLLGQQGTQSNLNASMVRAFEVPLPSRDEQKEIVSVLADADAEIALLSRRLRLVRALKEGLMQKLLSSEEGSQI